METPENKPPQDMSHYRLNDVGELLSLYRKYGPEQSCNLQEKIFRALTCLEPGGRYNLSRLPEDRKELVVKLCCLWIRHHPDYELSNDYTKIRRL